MHERDKKKKKNWTAQWNPYIFSVNHQLSNSLGMGIDSAKKKKSVEHKAQEDWVDSQGLKSVYMPYHSYHYHWRVLSVFYYVE